MPRHAVFTAATLSCLSAVAAADAYRAQPSGACCGSDHDGTRNNQLHNKYYESTLRGFPTQVLKHQPQIGTEDGWWSLLTLLAANFSIRR